MTNPIRWIKELVFGPGKVVVYHAPASAKDRKSKESN